MKSSNEISYEFSFNKRLNLLVLNLSQQDYIEIKVKVIDVISFAQINQKFHYNHKHQFIYFKKKNKIFLHLYKNYFIS